MNYSVKIKRSAVKELARVAKPERLRIMEAIDDLAGNPLTGSALKGQLQGLRRIRIGDLGVIYEVQEQQLVVLVVRVRHRRQAYR